MKTNLLLTSALLLTSCNFFPQAQTPPQSPKNTPYYNFDYRSVSFMTLSANLPETGENFTADLKYTGPEETDWTIESSQLLDRQADGFFIRHLLDTLHSLYIAGEIPFKNSSLSDLGLSPPRFAIRWSTSNGTPYEIQIGNKLKNEGQAYAILNSSSQPIIIGGAAIKMLDYVKSLASLRQKTFVKLSSDDVDEIEIYKNQKKTFNAERYGRIWKKNQLDKHLLSFAHTRIQSYIDDPETNAKILKIIQSKPFAEMTLKDRNGKPITVKIGKSQNQIFGTTSEKPKSAFLLYPEITRYFEFQK